MAFDFRLATNDDDPALRKLLAHSPMPGRLTVTFEREPNYFLGCDTMGRFWQVIIACCRPGGEIAGVMCRAVRPYWINGQRMDLGYIGQIRIADQHQGRWLLWRGLSFFKELHADNRVKTYFGVISDENAVARGVLVEKPSRHFPQAREAARIYTAGIILRRPKQPLPSPYTITRGSPEQLPVVAAFLQQHGAARQFFPVYEADDFNSPATRGFRVEDFVIASQHHEIVGVTGLWDQSSYKQTIVQHYEGVLRWGRFIYNAGLRLVGARRLPGSGEPLHAAYASFICVKDNNPAVFRPLLRQIYTMAAARGYASLMVGLTDQDPLLPAVKQYTHIAYHSRLYMGSWEDLPLLDNRPPYIEIAML